MDISVVDKPPSENELNLYPDIQFYPAFAAGVVPIHSVAGFSKDDPMILTREVLARIFRGNITTWNHPDIIATNQKHQTHLNDAGAISLVVHSHASIFTRVLKRALSMFDSVFNTQIGTSEEPIWNGIPSNRISFRDGDAGVISHVQFTPNTIGYASLSESDRYHMHKISLVPINNSFSATPADAHSVELAVFDKGLDFGNEGSKSSRLTADLFNAQNDHAWPISYYAYFVVKSDTIRQGSSCSTRKDIFDFLAWFYENNESHILLRRNSFGPLPEMINSIAREKIRSDFKCNGVPLYDEHENKVFVEMYSISLLEGIEEIISSAFESLHETVVVKHHIDHSEFINTITTKFEKGSKITEGLIGLVEGSDSLLLKAIETNENLQLIPYSAYAFGFIFNLCGNSYHETCPYSKIELNMDIMTISQILGGDIKYWDDSRIISHNQHLSVSLPHENIVVIKPENDEYFDKFKKMIKETNPSFSYNGASIHVASDDEARLEVIDRQYSISYTPIYGSFEDLIKLVRIKNLQGSYVPPDALNIQACGSDTFDSQTMKIDISKSMNSKCYPLSEMVYIVTPVQYSECNKDIQATTQYLQWLIKGGGSAAHSHDLIHHPISDHALTSSDKKYLGDTDDLEIPLQHAHFGAMFYLNVTGNGYRSDGTVLQIRITEQLERIKCETNQMLMKHAELGLIPQGLVYTVYACTSICILIIIGLGIWVYIYKKKRLIRNSSPIFMMQILLGATISLSAIFPMGMQDNTFSFHDPSMNNDWSNLDRACQAYPFLYSVGFGLSFSALFVKTWRMVKLFNNRRFKRLKITDWMLLKYQFAIIGAIVISNIVWLVVDPLVWKRVSVAVSDSGEVAESAGICTMSGNVYYAIGPLLGIMILLLMIGNYYTYKGRFVPSEYAESKWVGFSMVLYLEALVLGVPVVILSSGNAGASFVVKSVAIMLADFGTVLLIFIPKIWLLYGWGIDGQSSMNKEDSTGNSGSKGSKKRRKWIKNKLKRKCWIYNSTLCFIIKICC